MKNSNRILKTKVLMYHRVLVEKPKKGSQWHYVTVSDFRKQMNLIDRMGYTPITFSDYRLYMKGKLTLPSKPIIITFDDGYLDTFENAIPVLQELNMRAVIFVMGNRKLKCAQWDIMDESDDCPLMTDDQVRKANEMGFEIGAHSHGHLDLPGLLKKDLVYEVSQSKKSIEKVLKEPIHTFAYPYGRVNEKVKKVVSDSGFLFACGVYSGSAKFSHSMMDFRRLAINQSTSLLKFMLILLLPYQYIEWAYYLLKNKMKGNFKAKNSFETKVKSNNGTIRSIKFQNLHKFNSK